MFCIYVYNHVHGNMLEQREHVRTPRTDSLFRPPKHVLWFSNIRGKRASSAALAAERQCRKWSKESYLDGQTCSGCSNMSGLHSRLVSRPRRYWYINIYSYIYIFIYLYLLYIYLLYIYIYIFIYSYICIFIYLYIYIYYFLYYLTVPWCHRGAILTNVKGNKWPRKVNVY